MNPRGSDDREVGTVKTDQSIKRIVEAAIRRHSIEPATWRSTRLWDEGEPDVQVALWKACQFEDQELPILYACVGSATWALFTTRALHYTNGGAIGRVPIREIEDYELGHFKAPGERVARLTVTTRNGETHSCSYETGKPSMGPLYALMTLCSIASQRSR